MKKYFITIYLFGLLNIFIDCNTIAEVSLIVTPKELIGNKTAWSVLKRIDDTMMEHSSTFKSIQHRKDKDSLVDYLFNPSLYFRRNNITTSGLMNKISTDFTRIMYSRGAHSLSKFLFKNNLS